MGRSAHLRATSLTRQVLVLSWLLLLRPVPAVLADTGAGLFATVLPAGALPIAPITDFLLWQVTIDPGVSVVFPPGYFACCPGPVLTHVVAGELTLRAVNW